MGMRIKMYSWVSAGIIVIPAGNAWGMAVGRAVGQLSRGKHEIHK